jgi:hypothetical protein
VSRVRSRDTGHQTRRRKDPAVRAQYRRAYIASRRRPVRCHSPWCTGVRQLQRNSDRESDVWIPAVVKVVPVVVIDVDVIGSVPIVCPVFRPGIHQQEGISAVLETRISHIDRREIPNTEPVFPPEIETEAVLRNVVTAVASSLHPCAMIAFPPLSTILVPCTMLLPAAPLYPSPLLLPRGGLLLCTARLLLLRLLGPLLLRLLSGLSAPLLRLDLFLLVPASLLLRLLLLRLLGSLWLRLLSGLSPPLLPLPLRLLAALFLLLLRRALLLCGWWRTLLPPALLLFRLARFFLLLVLLCVRRDSRPEKQKQSSGSGTGSSNKLHSNRLR